MTLEKANEIRKLLDFRDRLISDIKELEQCTSISGHIHDGVNGLGFAWTRDSRQVRHLIEGTKKDLKAVEEKILSL